MRTRTRITFTLIIGAVIILLIAPSAFAIDFGGTLESATGYRSNEPSDEQWSQAMRAALWLSLALSDRLELAAEGSYTWTEDRPYLFDLDYLSLSGSAPGLFGQRSRLAYEAGRIPFSDFSGYVLSHRADGASLLFELPAFSVVVSGGYTGLLLKPNNRIAISAADFLDDEDDDVFFGPKRAFALARLELPEVLLRQSITAQLIYQLDLRSDEDERADTQYAGIGVSGPLPLGLYYGTFGYLGIGKIPQQNDADRAALFSWFAGASLRTYLERLLATQLEVEAIVASGDEDYSVYLEGNTKGDATAFLPVSRPTLGLVFSPELSNIARLRAGWSMKPLLPLGIDTVQAVAEVLGFFRPTTGPVSADEANTASDEQYLGTEFDLTVNVRPFSDLGFALSGGAFLPNRGSDGAFLEDADSIWYRLKAEASFSF